MKVWQEEGIGAITAGLSLVMALAPVTPALANSGTQATVATGVTKVLQVNPGSSVTAKFTYTATPTVIKGAKVDGKNTTSTEVPRSLRHHRRHRAHRGWH